MKSKELHIIKRKTYYRNRVELAKYMGKTGFLGVFFKQSQTLCQDIKFHNQLQKIFSKYKSNHPNKNHFYYRQNFCTDMLEELKQYEKGNKTSCDVLVAINTWFQDENENFCNSEILVKELYPVMKGKIKTMLLENQFNEALHQYPEVDDQDVEEQFYKKKPLQEIFALVSEVERVTAISSYAYG